MPQGLTAIKSAGRGSGADDDAGGADVQLIRFLSQALRAAGGQFNPVFGRGCGAGQLQSVGQRGSFAGKSVLGHHGGLVVHGKLSFLGRYLGGPGNQVQFRAGRGRHGAGQKDGRQHIQNKSRFFHPIHLQIHIGH